MILVPALRAVQRILLHNMAHDSVFGLLFFLVVFSLMWRGKSIGDAVSLEIPVAKPEGSMF